MTLNQDANGRPSLDPCGPDERCHGTTRKRRAQVGGSDQGASRTLNNAYRQAINTPRFANRELPLLLLLLQQRRRLAVDKENAVSSVFFIPARCQPRLFWVRPFLQPCGHSRWTDNNTSYPPEQSRPTSQG